VITAYVHLSIVAATIGDVATAAMQPTHLLAAIWRGDWVGWTRRMRVWGARRAKVSFFMTLEANGWSQIPAGVLDLPMSQFDNR
jgi:hypothetical protein